ncbi:putative transcription factor Homeodomain-TALE-KNOX family [Helianthus annuus]|uniref:Transcription factor Homeodomain-TALE-KNOX family n=1 Tax=Helianthus annuus TaxID=4232 RepID=A0A9K3I165_HELAN|nr:putative transcription factor Homeodomain-TALE-KNOX family [Helianthus annuus]KAJ0515192.1 putative transcription factor Homeodomain-TALE-KNOX family [Helianthus annuus]KAJ0531381.1 putative transcription factor Homeodomain-TALE-KNOX family [Helianthus annuus]KAJ0698224.1 putative transcription factor Homeodomain-TALE-KNOX family [Helianthus annuus]KAJ0701592.1 putative transcription factor Homeodomain-TALE-KNOX family [Helianthus annuus]
MHTSFSLFCFVSFCGNRFFKKNPHPTEKERTEIANKLNITINKVKFWFQNRRTQLKVMFDYIFIFIVKFHGKTYMFKKYIKIQTL